MPWMSSACFGLTVPQARAVLAAAYDEPLCALYVLALCLGLRRGVLLGLRWANVDLTADGSGSFAAGTELVTSRNPQSRVRRLHCSRSYWE